MAWTLLPNGDTTDDPQLDEATLITTIMRRLDAQDQEIARLRESNDRIRTGMALLARKLRISCDAVAEAAEVAERLSEEL